MPYFTGNESFFVVPLDANDGEMRKIRFFLDILERSGVGKLIEEAQFKMEDRGRKSHNPYRLFAVILYCFAMKKGSLRDIEEMCRYDLRARFLMNQEEPSHKTVSEFINGVILPNAEKIFTMITSRMVEEFSLDISDHYLDGTKIEANANKYKFVWKPGKKKESLSRKIEETLSKMGKCEEEKEIGSRQLYGLISEYAGENGIDPASLPSGRGHRLSPEQKLLKTALKQLEKLLEYEETEMICGPDRKSYYKTDRDATAMALKTDYYSGHGSNLHAAYNVQFLVSAGFIMYYGVFHDRTDYYTMIPLLEGYRRCYGCFPENLCADSGYGIYANYRFLEDKGIGNYVKHLGWNGESSGKTPQLFFFDGEKRRVLCLNGKEGEQIPFDSSVHQKRKGGRRFRFKGCLSCPYAYKCKEKVKEKETDARETELVIDYEILKEKTRKRLLSLKGIEIRVNRSIQAEGSFGQLKQNLQYVRMRRRGMRKVSCEIMLEAMAINIRKVFSLYGKNDIRSYYWKAGENIRNEEFPKPKKKAVTN